MALTLCQEPGCTNPAHRRGRCRTHLTARPRGSTWAWRKLRALVIHRDHGICHICGQPGANSADHIIRAQDGGPDALWNLKAAHLDCNIKRG